MNLKLFCTVWLLLPTVSANAMDGEFDRSAEVAGYLRVLKADATRGTLTETAHQIYEARLYDEALAQAVFDKLSADLPTLNTKSQVDLKYRQLMIGAIAGTGVMKHAPALEKICATVETKRKVSTCDKQLAKMEWYKKRNQTMASRKYHTEGANVRASQIMNLLMSDDYTLKLEGVSQMNWGKILDARLMEAIEPQVLDLLSQVGTKGFTSLQMNTLEDFVKMLGFSDNPKYRPTVEKVHAAKVSNTVRQRAKTALRRFDQAEAAGKR
jgi:hypothetical protein